MGAITQAMARSAEAAGVEIETEAAVAEVLVEGGKTTGVRLQDGRIITARSVAANVNPKLLFLHLLAEDNVAPAFRRRMENWRCKSGTLRMNVAFGELPNITNAVLSSVPRPSTWTKPTLMPAVMAGQNGRSWKC